MSQLKMGALLSYVVLGLQNLVGLLYTPFLLRMLGKSEYGLYSIATSVIAYLAVLDLGFGNAVIRYTAKYRAEGKIDEQQQLFGLFFLLYCGIGLVTLVVGGGFCFGAESFFDTAMTSTELIRLKFILFLMVLNLAFTFPFSLFGSIIYAYERFVVLKIVVILRIILNTATMIVLLNFGYKAVALVVVTTIFNVVTLLFHLFYCWVILKIRLKKPCFQRDFVKEIGVYSFWIFLNAIIDRVYWSTGPLILGSVAGPTTVAVFAVATKLQGMYMGLSTAISGVFLPKVTAMTVNNHGDRDISDLFVKTGRIQYSVLSLVLAGFILFGRSFVKLWAGNGYEDAYVISLLFFVPLTVPLIQTLGITILQARNQMKFRSLLYLGISLGSLFFQIPLAKYYGGVGCACAIAGALVIGQVLVMNVYYQVKQKIDIVGFWWEILKMSVAPFFVVVAFFITLPHFVFDSWMSFFAGIAVFAAVYLPIFYVFSMNSYEKKLVLAPLVKLGIVRVR